MCDTLIIKADAVIGYNDEFVEEIVIPEGVSKIAKGAFQKCYGLKHIILPESLKSIGDSAFEKCSSLETITLPEEVSSLGEGAFKECIALKNVDFSKSKIKALPYECFWGCKKLTSVKLPNTTLKIINRCFMGCKSLKDLQLNEGLKVIEDDFYDCTSLTTVFIPSTLIHLEDLSYRRTITKVHTTVEQFDKFRELLPSKCELKAISLVEGIAVDFSKFDDFKIEGTVVIEYVGDKLEVVVPFGITEIGTEAFYGAPIKSITFPSTLRKIRFGAFHECQELETVVINEGVTIIEEVAFSQCEKLREISLPKSLLEIESYAFGACRKVESINCNGNNLYSFIDGCLIENGNTIIESFGHRIPENPDITDIAEGAFEGYGYFHVTIPKNIKNIYSDAFLNNIVMQTLEINHNVYIETGAFSCEQLTQLVLSSECDQIEAGAFVVPRYNMLNVYVNSIDIPECIEDSVRFVGYSYYGGQEVTPNKKSGTHRLWDSSEWEERNTVIYPKVNLVHEGDSCNIYFVGYGFDTIDCFTVSFAIIKKESDWSRYSPKVEKLNVVHVEVDGVDYVYDIYEDSLCKEVDIYFPTNIYLNSRKLLNALFNSNTVHLDIELLDYSGEMIDAVGIDLFLK